MTFALGYVRLSRLTEESTSVERQREVITAACAAREWTLAGIEEDVDVSASAKSLAERPGLQRAKARMDAGEASVLVVWRLDRLARSVGDFSIVIGTRPGDWGLQVASATEPLDTSSPMGRAMAQVLQVFAELEAKTIGLRVASSIDYLRREGRNSGGLVTFGQKTIPNPAGAGFVTVVDDELAMYVREAIRRVHEGETVGGIAADFAARRVPTGRRKDGSLASGAWWNSSLARLLRNPAIAGMTRHRGDLIRDPATGVPRVDPAKAIVTTEERRALLAALDERATYHAPTGRPMALLRGVVVCASCEKPLAFATSSARPSSFYRCRTPKGDAPGRCPRPVGVSLTRLEETVESKFLRAVGRFPVVERVEIDERPSPSELRDVGDAIAETLTAMGDRDDLDDLLSRLAALKMERRRLESALDAPAPPIQVDHDGTFAEVWADEDTDGRRALLLSALDRVVVHVGHQRTAAGYFDPDRVELQWREGDADPD